jgi:phage tail sheath gpL-like
MSNAVGLERVSRIVGYKLTKGDFSEVTRNLPMRVAIIGEANEANQATLNLQPKQVTSAKQAGQLYGFGSPIYSIMRILKPVSGDGVGGIPVYVYPQAKAAGATSKVLDITPTGVATANGTHTLIICGRNGIDGVLYDINIVAGDSVAAIAGKIANAINNVLGCPVSAVSSATKATATSKWAGLTADEISISVDTNDTNLGITYAVTLVTAAAGTPSIQSSLESFGNTWNTIVINSYGTVASIMTVLENFNGIPDPDAPTGRYAAIMMKPFIALTGSTLEDPSAITDARLNNVTIAICPAPLSKGFSFEAAANIAALFARQAQDNPHLDIAGKSYPDMPTPEDIGAMSDYDERDAIVKRGCSTVDLVTGKYVVQDFVLTYHPIGEEPPQWRYVRNLVIDFNMRFGYYLLEQIHVVDHAIAGDNDTVLVGKVIKPKMWKQIVDKYAKDQSEKGLIVDPAFMQKSITTGIGTNNPDRLETFFRYKRSGFARISSTTAEAGFNYGTLN